MLILRLLNVCVVTILLYTQLACALEPVTTGVAFAVAGVVSAMFAGYDLFKCKVYECCEKPWTQFNISGKSA